jgi:hypothetical protein
MTRVPFALAIALALALALAGCAADHCPPPAVSVKPIAEKVLVRQPCVAPGDVLPEPPRISDQLDGDALHDLPIVSLELLEMRSWGEDSAGKLTRCASAQVGMTQLPAQIAGQ